MKELTFDKKIKVLKILIERFSTNDYSIFICNEFAYTISPFTYYTMHSGNGNGKLSNTKYKNEIYKFDRIKDNLGNLFPELYKMILDEANRLNELAGDIIVNDIKEAWYTQVDNSIKDNRLHRRDKLIELLNEMQK